MMRSYQRIFLIVIDSLGISGAPDAAGKAAAVPPDNGSAFRVPSLRPAFLCYYCYYARTGEL